MRFPARLTAAIPALAAGLLPAALFPGAALGAASVSAGQAEAKEVARSGNCTPTKVEVMRYTNGRLGETVFKVSCSEDKEAFVLVQCRSRTCALLR